jgi:hypothetical protein
VSSVPFTRSLPYVLREKLGAAAKGGHAEGVSSGVSVLLGKVTAVPNNKSVTVLIGASTVTVPKISTYVPVVNEPCVILSDPLVTVAIGAVRA